MRDTSPTNDRLQEALEWARESAKCQRCADYGYLIRNGALEDKLDTRIPCPDCGGTRYEYGHRQVDILISAIRQRDEVMADMEQSEAHTLAFGLNEYQRLLAQIEIATDALHDFADWARSYPTSVWHEPDEDELAKAHAALKSAGRGGIDALSAMIYRHALKHISERAQEYLDTIAAMNSSADATTPETSCPAE